jgi:hypothetical protein
MSGLRNYKLQRKSSVPKFAVVLAGVKRGVGGRDEESLLRIVIQWFRLKH